MAGVTWYKRVYPDGTIKYNTEHAASYTVNGNAWRSDIAFSLPDSLVWDASTMELQASGRATDAALIVGGARDGNAIRWTAQNKFGSNVTSVVRFHMAVTVYPSPDEPEG
ncbi:MAG: hypothetical protein EOM35_03940 [Negativicutes bacterium]|nr:hypothetical protein [Negativicutes bacterium]